MLHFVYILSLVTVIISFLKLYTTEYITIKYFKTFVENFCDNINFDN